MSEPETEVLWAQLVSKAVLQPDEKELYELTQLAGNTMDPEVFKILLDLLKLNVPPVAIVQSLRSMCSSHPSYPEDENIPPSQLASGDTHPDVYRINSSTDHTFHDRQAGDANRSGQSIYGDHRTRVSSAESRKGHSNSSHQSYTRATSYSKGANKSSYSAESLPSSNYKTRPHDKKGTSPSRGDNSTPWSRNLTSLTGGHRSDYRDSERTTKKNSSFR